VMQKCLPMMVREFTMSWPEDLKCWQFPNDNCMDTNGPVLTPPPSSCSVSSETTLKIIKYTRCPKEKLWP
jgi:hypothetical protein